MDQGRSGNATTPSCSVCGRRMHVKKLRRRRVYTLEGPICYVSKLMHCPHTACPNHRRTFSPEQELSLALPRWLIGWDVFCWLGHRRFARHWSVPQLRAELVDSYAIVLSEDAIEDYLQRYQCMLAARQQDFAVADERNTPRHAKSCFRLMACNRRKGTRRFTWCANLGVSASGSRSRFCRARPTRFAR